MRVDQKGKHRRRNETKANNDSQRSWDAGCHIGGTMTTTTNRPSVRLAVCLPVFIQYEAAIDVRGGITRENGTMYSIALNSLAVARTDRHSGTYQALYHISVVFLQLARVTLPALATASLATDKRTTYSVHVAQS